MRSFLTHKKTDALAIHHFEGIQTFWWRNALVDCARLAAAVERHALKCCVPDMRPASLLSSLPLATQRARASTPHRGSKETILSESRDVAKMKKDSRCCPHSVLQL